MTNLDSGGVLARLADVCARVRGAARPDDVLDVAAEEARVLAGAGHAWAARVEDGVIASLRRISDETAAAPGRPPPAPPPALAAMLASARPIARADGFVAVALLGSDGTPEGILALPCAAAAEDAALDLALGHLALVTGLALEGARLRARVEAVTRVRQSLLASVSHDLRNPLNTFAMSAGLLRDDFERTDVDVARGINLVSRMERAISRMQSLIEDLGEASRIDARKIDFAIRAERAAQIVKDAAAAATLGASDKGVTVICDTLDEDARVLADRARTLQLLSQVIAVEAKSTGDAGTIRLAVTGQGDSVLFTVSAISAGGMPVPAPEEGRCGIGLLIARGLVEAQRGTFRVEAGKGFVVAFTLPAAKG